MSGEGKRAHRASRAGPSPREARHRADRQSSRDDNLWGVRPPGPSPRDAVSIKSSKDKRPKRSLRETLTHEGSAISALGAFGRGTHVSGTAAVGFPFPDPSGQRSFIDADSGPIELNGGSWGRGQLIPTASGDWQWQPEVAYDSEAVRDQDVWSFRRGEMDLRLRFAARIPVIAEPLRITGAGRTQMLAELPSTGLTNLIASLAKRYGLTLGDLAWQETPEPEGHNNSRFATYQIVVPGTDNRPALLGSLWFMLSGTRAIDVSSVVDLSIDFAAIQPRGEQETPAHIAPGLRIAPNELVGFFTSAWQAAAALVLTTGQSAEDVPSAGAPRLELYIQNRHPEGSGGPRILRILDMVDLSFFGETRRRHLGDLSIGVTAPLVLTVDEIRSLVRQGLIRTAEDFGFTAADTAEI